MLIQIRHFIYCNSASQTICSVEGHIFIFLPSVSKTNTFVKYNKNKIKQKILKTEVQNFYDSQ